MSTATKDKLRAFLAKAQQKASASAHAAKMGARSLGRRASSAAARRKRTYCSTMTPEQNTEEMKSFVNRALRVAYKGIGREPQQITDSASALRIGMGLKMTPGRDDAAQAARLAGEAATHVRYAMDSGSAKEWDEALEYADDALDRAGET